MIDDNRPAGYVPPSGGGGLKTAILFGAVIALLAATVYLFFQVDAVKTDLSKTRESLLAELSKVRETSSVTTQSNRRTLDSLKEQLDTARRQASMAAGQARIEAQKHADELAVKLKEEQVRQGKALHGEIGEVKQATDTQQVKLGEVSTEVGTVKSDVAATRSDLEKTVAELKRVTGDLGVTSGLVATNGTQLSALKALGERNYFEFKLQKTKEPQKVGDIAVFLKKTDPKKNKYTIELIADDKRVEKKDKLVNEPLQFYVAKARQPYEIVVNDVKKDQISGYLATPKVQESRN